jgi:hypothetical protein
MGIPGNDTLLREWLLSELGLPSDNSFKGIDLAALSYDASNGFARAVPVYGRYYHSVQITPVTAVFSIQYTGAGSAATLTINSTTLSTTITGGPGGEALSLTLASYATLALLVAAIEAGGPYTVVVTHPHPETAPTGLDALTAQAIKAAPLVVNSTDTLKIQGDAGGGMLDIAGQTGLVANAIRQFTGSYQYLQVVRTSGTGTGARGTVYSIR